MNGHPVYFKTHEGPHIKQGPIKVPTIIIVRDARRVFESLRSFMSIINGINISMIRIIQGRFFWGNWSDWVFDWASNAPDGALWLRYEDIMANHDPAIDAIANHIGIDPISRKIPEFSDLKKGTPNIFRKASMVGNGGMSESEEEAFWRKHGEAMAFLGYDRDQDQRVASR